MPDTIDLDGLSIDSITPATPDALSEIVRVAHTTSKPLYWVGGGTSLDAGLPPRKAGTAVRTTLLDKVIDYPARDMTITVQSGIRISTLQEILAKEKQTLPLDIPWPDKATLGGVLACNTSGSRRLAHGTPRDFVIGLTVLNDQGRPTKSGGRVVKNVAGYDMAKLHVGALGTLGPIVQVTLKVRPLPPARAWLAMQVLGDALETACDRAHGCQSRPVAFDLLALPGGPVAWTAMIGFEGEPDAVAWQVARAKTEFSNLVKGNIIECQASTVDAMATKLAERTDPAEGVVLALGCLPSRTAALAARVLADLPGAVVHALPGSGLIKTVTSAQVDPRPLLAGWRQAAGPGGWARLVRAPRAWKTADATWGAPRPESTLSSAIQRELDPKGLFNPGRLLHQP